MARILILTISLAFVHLSQSSNVTIQLPDLRNENGSQAMFNYLEFKFTMLEYDLKEQNEILTRNQARLERNYAGMLWMLTQFQEATGRNITMLLDQSWRLLEEQKSCSNHDDWRKQILNLNPMKAPSEYMEILLKHRIPGPYDSCSTEPSKTSGKYKLQPLIEEEKFVGFCEQTKFGGGWLVIQHRYDGTVDFYRNWTEYKNGFGDAEKEFWIGLELLHKLTSSKPYQLLVELEDFTGVSKYAKYAEFEIGNETEKYALKKLGTYSGTAGDSLVYHKGMKFTTVDSDNDSNTANCAIINSGAWWYNSCHHSNLNGKFINVNDVSSMTWYHFKNAHYGLKYSRMMIKEVK
ncbi:ficolin-3-like [Wyeomyia smithii]|uniref:ficolin-3-like n=1 Tax=Wyeomyia smithii TaxID=174621 RepID=UPI002467C250|nr:ficolin-3-like [Wyeomyia smithii]